MTKIPLRKGTGNAEKEMGVLLNSILGEGLTAKETSDRVPGK